MEGTLFWIFKFFLAQKSFPMRGIDAQKNEALKNCKAKPKDVDIVGLEKNHNILFVLQKFSENENPLFLISMLYLFYFFPLIH